jgi:hypothetical protein
MESSRDNEQAEVISDSHLAFMRSYCEWEERIARASLERFLRERKIARDASDLKQIKMRQKRS